ncbi:MAG: hypothetical protein ACRC8Y_01110 [Chroococcales cyanobacterium]
MVLAHVCSNDFSRCSRVMDDAMTRTISSFIPGLGSGSSNGAGRDES